MEQHHHLIDDRDSKTIFLIYQESNATIFFIRNLKQKFVIYHGPKTYFNQNITFLSCCMQDFCVHTQMKDNNISGVIN